MQAAVLEIAIVGATGAVGAVALELLAERGHPAEKLRLLASKRSHGKQIEYAGQLLTVEEATPESFDGVDVAFISASSEVSLALAPEAVKRGVLVIDDGSAYRMDPAVPLVVPEVNGADVEWHSGIISIPNCTTTPLVMALAALRGLTEISSVTVSTYQSVTGTGAAARAELLNQSREMLGEKEVSPPREYPHSIGFNLLPQVDDFIDEGYTKEEWKMVNESRKILDDPKLRLASTCVRVPVEVSHCEAVTVEFDDPISVDEARVAIAEFPGITLLDRPHESVYPMPSNSAGEDDVMVGRIRRDLAHENGVVFWLATDNLRKGAALNALQIMDECVKRNCVRPRVASAA
ncbi:MAG: aspartate-semialdehyde dehydrogenase [Chloroflexi bacterium]|nr:aspartate-semialdehyde dehydrogenase [Chloroflexota bacterium]MYF79300.1 aspartate-semialdehyde dehydrogenase [Chloroflexota bacterium]MYK61896.1 aspartate-semialdehyde dehydrogenase [Chloroflexota bacterium]